MSNSCAPRILSAGNLRELLKYDIKTSEFCMDRILNWGLLKKLGMKFAIIYHYDYVESDVIEKVDMNLENIMEARFFAEDREIRIFNDEGELSGTIFLANEANEKIREEYYLFPRSKGKEYPQKLIANKYIGYDTEDNQAYISYVAPAGFIFKEGEMI
ncbi:MAG: hypothetical protein GX796_12875 [Clostridiaceae bacterium]|jgi:hypothetical protein|nr:hypothetical protein [Clostridiaceae bacterium]